VRREKEEAVWYEEKPYVKKLIYLNLLKYDAEAFSYNHYIEINWEVSMKYSNAQYLEAEEMQRKVEICLWREISVWLLSEATSVPDQPSIHLKIYNKRENESEEMANGGGEEMWRAIDCLT